MNAMPFGPSENPELRNRLVSRREQLRDEISAALRSSGDAENATLAGHVHDLGEESLADLLADVRLAGIARDVQEVRDIEAALQRMQGGTYGVCTDCGKLISLARLHVYPTAKRCRPCQETREKTRKVAHTGTI